jgi:hypothetical protein
LVFIREKFYGAGRGKQMIKKINKTIQLTLFLLLTTVCINAYADIPHLINYQGKLTDSQGVPLNGSYDVTFRIYDAASGGNLLWTEEHTQAKGAPVTVTKGIFSIMLGSLINLNLAFDKPYWLAIQVGNDPEMSPRQQITSVGYAIRAETAELAKTKTDNDDLSAGYIGEKIDDVTLDLNTSAHKIRVKDTGISQAKLKTTTGEVSHSGTRWNSYILPGGEYGFYPQYKNSGTDFIYHFRASIVHADDNYIPTYITRIDLNGNEGGSSEASTIYIRQRYVTSSGENHWLFLLLDKNTKDIIGAYSAPDHPAYGNGGDFEKLSHPFGNYDETKHEIILVANDTIAILKKESETTGKSLLTLVNEKYKVNIVREEDYKPLHSGKYLTQDGKQVKQMVESLPDYIKVRKLEKLTVQENADREIKRQLAQKQAENIKQKKEKDRINAINKLKAMGLTEEEVKALKE